MPKHLPEDEHRHFVLNNLGNATKIIVHVLPGCVGATRRGGVLCSGISGVPHAVVVVPRPPKSAVQHVSPNRFNEVVVEVASVARVEQRCCDPREPRGVVTSEQRGEGDGRGEK